VIKESPAEVWAAVSAAAGLEPADTLVPTSSGKPPREVLVTFRLPLSKKLSIDEQLSLVARQGFQRLLHGDEVLRVEVAAARIEPSCPSFVVIQDRVRMTPENRARFIEACEQAYQFGHGKLTVVFGSASESTEAGMGVRWSGKRPFSSHLHCAVCDIEYREPVPALFSFNNPIGACPACKGFGRVIAIDYDLAIPDRSRSLADGAVKPWQSGSGAESQADLARFAKRAGVPMNVPFRQLTESQQRWVIDGDPDYGEGHEYPHAWYGVKGYFRWLESKAYKMHVRVLLSRYRAYRTCPQCHGQRLQPDALLWRLAAGHLCSQSTNGDATTPWRGSSSFSDLSLADFYALPIRRALDLINGLAAGRPRKATDPLTLALAEAQDRLRYLVEVGVGYLTLDRPTRTLSGGETQRVNLTTCLGSRLVNTLFVLDEPSVGLHPRDTERLVGILTRLRAEGNTVVVVEHETAVMRAADQILDLGPGHGESGGRVVIQGAFNDVIRHPRSLTGAYLSGRARIELPTRRPVSQQLRALTDTAIARTEWRMDDQTVPYAPIGGSADIGPALVARGISRHNLRHLDVAIPLGRLVCLSGVSGSGKTTLVSELLRLLRDQVGPSVSGGALGVREAEHEEGNGTDSQNGAEDRDAVERPAPGASMEGAHYLGAVMLVDQSPIGRTPRSNPAVYTGAFDPIRDMFAESESARQRGLGHSAFSFNSVHGQCERCRGAGFERIEMQFLSDVFIRCPACEGRRYRPHVLEVKLPADPGPRGSIPGDADDGISIADLLEQTVEHVMRWLKKSDSPHAPHAAARLRFADDLGLGYLRMGQPINTLSGGESQRLKLAGHLAKVAGLDAALRHLDEITGTPGRHRKPTLFVFDEPTTGLHLEDVRILLRVFQKLVDDGHSVLIIEHHPEVLKCADWLIDLGPEAGEDGGRIIAAGTPEEVAACEASHTGRALRRVL
jgi:excinuclease ABC subunit A